MSLSKFLKEVIKENASDIHFKVGSPPILRIGKQLVNLPYQALTIPDIEGFIAEILGEARRKHLKDRKEIDIAYIAPDIGRFRVDIFYQRGMPGIVMRRVKTEFEDFSSLSLPSIIKDICDFNEGIVLVCGPARSGKSTTIATMINHINNTRRLHVITVEDPIEFLYEDKECVIDQREIGIDTESFNTALKYIMREDPDLVFIGELRDKDSFQAAINVAETGHMVFTTLHTNSMRQAIDRILNYFPQEQRDAIRIQFANYFKVIIIQHLLPKADSSGLVPVVEVMINNVIIKEFIRENKLSKLSAAIELGTNSGMQTLNRSLLKLIQSGVISEEVGLAKSSNPEALKLNLQGIFLDDAKKILEG